MRDKLKGEIAKYSLEKCTDELRSRTALVMEGVRDLIDLHECNSIALYSDVLRKQIPKSYAAHAFNNFRRAMLGYEVAKVCALWDSPDIMKINIPTLICFLERDGVVQKLGDRAMNAWLNIEPHFMDPADDPELDEIRKDITNRHKLASGQREKDNSEKRICDALQMYETVVRDGSNTQSPRQIHCS